MPDPDMNDPRLPVATDREALWAIVISLVAMAVALWVIALD
jgi:hypothetical protein